MIIRNYTPKDSKNVKDLLVELQEYIIEIDKFNLNIISSNYRDKYFDYMVSDCNSKQGAIFVAEQENQVIGFIAGFVETYDEKDALDYACPKKGIVAELIVSKNSRSKGCGKLLLNKMEEYFNSIGCNFAQIDVFAYNETARNFYKKTITKNEWSHYSKN